MKRYFKILLIIISIFLFVGCKEEVDNSYTFDEGDFKITLTTDFIKKTMGTTKYYYSHNEKLIDVFVNEETYEQYKIANVEIPEDVMAYAEFVIKANGLVDAKTVDHGDYVSFTYEKIKEGLEFFYYAVAYKGSNGYYLINFDCYKDKKDDYLSSFEKWAKTISVK